MKTNAVPAVMSALKGHGPPTAPMVTQAATAAQILLTMIPIIVAASTSMASRMKVRSATITVVRAHTVVVHVLL